MHWAAYPINTPPSVHLFSSTQISSSKSHNLTTANKFTALFAILSLVSLVVANASIHRTVVRTEIDEVNTGRHSPSQCRQQIRSQDLSHCKRFITHSGASYNPEHRQQCCQQLRQMDEDCRCEALMEIVRKQQQQGQMESEEMQEMMQRAKSIPTYCRMGRCQWSEMGDANPQGGCHQQIQKHDFNKCQKFITQSGQRSGIVMTTSNPEMYLQGCCQQLSKVDKQCRCEALKEIMREQQQEGEFQGQEMQEMMQRAHSIPRMCNMEPRSCQWRYMLY